MTQPPDTYRHTQNGPWYLLLISIAILQLTLSYVLRNEGLLTWMFLSFSVLMLLLAFACRTLTVAHDRDSLLIFFGPLPLFKQRIAYQKIESARVAKTTFLDGWGMHFSIRGGWVWNIWGFNCVHLRYQGKQLWLGTDEPDKLLSWINSQLAQLKSDTTEPSPEESRADQE
jgi:hypothetical protein